MYIFPPSDHVRVQSFIAPVEPVISVETVETDICTASPARCFYFGNKRYHFSLFQGHNSVSCLQSFSSSQSSNQMTAIYIPCELSEGVSLPTYAHDTDAGLDIYSPQEYTIGPGETIIIPTGIKMAIPDGYAILIQPRSGQSAKTKLRVANTPGLIDSGYRDEIGVIVENIEPPFKDIDYEFDDNGEIHIKSILHGEAYTIAEGQRFAQMRLVQVPKAIFTEVASVGEIGEDRNGGFGSTGLK